MVPFAGYSMPVQYSGIVGEHQHTRTAAGLFDVSHMGQASLSGPGAAAFLEMVTDPAYREAVKHRTAAVSDSRLVRCGADATGEGFAG